MKINKLSNQLIEWSSKWGDDYTRRNPKTIIDMDKDYFQDHGITRTKMNKDFLNGINRSIKILEIGANIGLQLNILEQLGFKNLTGIEVNEYAIRSAKSLNPRIRIIHGCAQKLPFKNEEFDLVFTSVVLIHIPPRELKKVLGEIYRVSKKYIWGFEYYSKKPIGVIYRGREKLLWKRDFLDYYIRTINNLEIVKEKKYSVRNSNEINQMFLLKKNNSNL